MPRTRIFALVLLCGATGLLLAGLWAPFADHAAAFAFGAGASFAAAVLVSLRQMRRRRQEGQLVAALSEAFEGDETAFLVADPAGRVLAANRAASGRFQGQVPQTMLEAFSALVAAAGPLLTQMQERAAALGGAREEIVTRRDHLRVTVSRIGAGVHLWRFDDMAARSGRSEGGSLPMLTAGPTGAVLFMNEAMRRFAGGRVKALDLLFHDLPLVSGRVHLAEGAAGPVSCLVAEVAGSGGRREIYLLPAGRNEPRRSMAEWQSLEDLPVPLLKLAPDGLVLASTREARALLPNPIGPETRLSDLVDGLGRPVHDWLGEVFEGRGGTAPQFLQGSGGQGECFLQMWMARAGGAEEPHVVAVLRDMTELKSLEAQMVQSQKMQAIGQLAGGVAHDFNNLLTAISGHCDLLLLRHDQGDGDYADLIQISQNANRAAALVSQLLAFSRKQNLMPEVVDLGDALSDLAHLLGRLVGEKVTLSLIHEPDLMPIRADRRQLEQVIMNLVVNARDAMKEGGEISVETENVTLAEPLERDSATVPAGRWVVVRVIDTGIGMSPEKAKKVFEPFFTTKRPGEGTGLGLSTAYGIVKQTGGYIFLDTAPGEGTTFSIYLPAYQGRIRPEPTQPPRPLPRPPARAEDGVVLLVEDEAPVRAFASRALRLQGYTVLEADSAEAALSLLQDKALAVDIFVTDVIMPGKDGPTWVREALKERPGTRVVFVSGYAEDSFAEHKAHIPNSVFLPKPFSLADLTAKVQSQLQ